MMKPEQELGKMMESGTRRLYASKTTRQHPNIELQL